MVPGRRKSQAGPEQQASPQRRERNMPVLRVIGQVGAMYVVAEGPEGMYLVDQHAAHERVLYEELMARREHEPLTQHLLEATTVEMVPDEAALIDENWDDLLAVGFAIEHFGGTTFLVRAVPAILAEGDPADAIRAALSDIDCGQMPGDATATDRIISRVCKQAAIKGRANSQL